MSFIFLALCTLPFWMLAIPLYIASQLRSNAPRTTNLSLARVVGTISSLTALAYRTCEIGTWREFDSEILALRMYRGFPFPWVGWNLFDASFAPMWHLFLDLLVWSIGAFLLMYLFEFAQVLFQLKLARVDRVLLIGALVSVLPLFIAVIRGGAGC